MVSQQGQQAQIAAAQPKFREEMADNFFANIHQDKRVYRGSTYNSGSPKRGGASPKTRRAGTRPKAVDPFAIDLPKPERIPVDLVRHLEEKPRLVHQSAASSQTDALKPKEPPKPFVPKKTGVDASTHIEEASLFDFDREVEPLASVLVAKTIEQAQMEVEEEFEMSALADYKEKWVNSRMASRSEELAAVAEERSRMEATEAERKKRVMWREGEVRRKIMCQAATKRYLLDLCGDAVHSLKAQHGSFPSIERRIVATQFMPWLSSAVSNRLAKVQRNQSMVDALVTAVSSTGEPAAS
ncbi:unnamed protein product [Amoebophrya sp. A25]|nr:unnamed protein product [Amoebophrya sp. A25]|eukprot:GSA25T00022072001.1